MNFFRLPTALMLAGFPLLVSCSARAQNPVQAAQNQNQNQTQNTALLNPLFSDDAVLQRDRIIPIWGQAAPGQTVTCSISDIEFSSISGQAAHTQTISGPLDDQTRTARADATGRWMVRVGPFAASAKPHTLSVSTPNQTLTRRNIVFGDVWLCSGQSNMEFGVGNLSNAQQEIAGANFPLIRLLKVPKLASFTPQTTVDARWLVCNPQSIAQGGWNGFSAVGYFFGRKLHQELGVPIGLIDSSWGGTVAEAWTSESALGTLPDFRPQLARVQQAVRDENVPFDQRTEAWLQRNAPNYKSNWATTGADVSKWSTIRVPGEWGVSGVAALRDFDGIALFRREVEVPANWAGHDLTVQLGEIDDNDTTYWNGVAVGSTTGWNNNRRYTIPGAQVKAGRNIVAVRVTDTGGGGGLTSPPETLRLERDATTSLPLAGDWRFLTVASKAQMATAPLRVDQSNPNVTSALYNGMISPLVPFGMRGAIWYQGESNAERAEQYERLLPTLIGNWRRDFGTPMPFYIVQLAGFMAPDEAPRNDDWPRLRAAQMKVAQTDPNSGIAITTDIGDEKDIHPKDKQDVGLRLALVALAKNYGKNVESSGPSLVSAKPEGATLRLTFAHAGGGLTLKGEANRVFAVCGTDRNWFWAAPRIEGSTVVLSSPMVARPVAVRFGWSNLPRATLYNGAGLPAAPFETNPPASR
jgi:sialate O-acetylesterase